MAVSALPTWHQANLQYLLASLHRVNQALADYITRLQSSPIQIPSVPKLAPEALAVLQNNPSTLDQLCNLFNLSSFERDILLLCAGMELNPYFEELCTKAQGSLKRNYPTLGLALSIFPEINWRIFSSKSPLQTWNLLEIEQGQTLTKSPIRINSRIFCYLLGEPCEDDDLIGILKPIPPFPPSSLPPSYQQLTEQLIATWSQKTPTSIFPIVQLCGAELGAKHTIAAAGCSALGLHLNFISASQLPLNPHELYQLKQRCLREAILTNSALLLTCDELNQTDGMRELAISQFVEDLNLPLILSTQERQPQNQRPMITLDVGQLSHREQKLIWESYLGSTASELNGQLDTLVSHFNLNPLAIQAACLSLEGMEFPPVKTEPPKETEPEKPASSSRRTRKSKSQTSKPKIENPFSPLQTHLWDFCRTQARPRLDDLAQRIDAVATWEELILPEREKNTLQEIAAHVRQRAKVYQEWGFAGKGGRGLGVSALFSGPSGTGKTMAAEVLAKELRIDVYRIDLSAVVSKYIGETEKNLRRIFDAAETGGVILLFDEADALFGKRTQVKDSHDRHANVEVSYLLQRMEAYQGLAILTTNLLESLDQAFLRRINFSVKFPFPDAEARAEIWQHIFPEETPTKRLDMKKLGKVNMAGGNIRNIALNAAFLAADAGEAVMMKHILQSTKSESLKLGRILTDVEISGWV
ncbi:ATP-binding protein [Coleofasciculus sp. F4-SAH-05]|uniref:ATP-binding protein n=1 Tax=Coleofasciculus sp. F4-SAH-05 TaxID=3069525 RepID=UPI0032F3CBD6